MMVPVEDCVSAAGLPRRRSECSADFRMPFRGAYFSCLAFSFTTRSEAQQKLFRCASSYLFYIHPQINSTLIIRTRRNGDHSPRFICVVQHAEDTREWENMDLWTGPRGIVGICQLVKPEASMAFARSTRVVSPEAGGICIA